jgi:aspartyl-tRNA(Asn)/glutamyl-tRNA(Gln) amidotransferase subunit A
MKGTYGRIPRGPHAYIRPSTVVLGCLARSARDVARYYDVCAGYDTHDPTSLPGEPAGAWEAGLGASLAALRGKRVAVDVGLGGVPVTPEVEARVNDAADALVADLGLVRVEREVTLPNLAAQWMMGNVATLLADLGSRWPACARELTDEIAVGLLLAQSLYNLHTAAVAEAQRVAANEAMASLFDEVDLVIAATNPDPAFPADAAMSSAASSFIDWAKSNDLARLGFRGVMGVARVGSGVAPKLPNALLDLASSRFPDLVNMGALTIVSNLCGNPAVSIPVEPVDGLPVGMQVLARHHADALLLDVALAVERARPWPRTATYRSATAS